MVGGAVQSGQFDQVIPVQAGEGGFIQPQIVKKELAQFLPVAAGGAGVQQIAYCLFRGSEDKPVSVFLIQDGSVRESGNRNIPVGIGSERRIILLLSSLAACGGGERIDRFRDQVMPGKRKFKGEIGWTVNDSGQAVAGDGTIGLI